MSNVQSSMLSAFEICCRAKPGGLSNSSLGTFSLGDLSRAGSESPRVTLVHAANSAGGPPSCALKTDLTALGSFWILAIVRGVLVEQRPDGLISSVRGARDNACAVPR
jgi:hypothetical protein